MKKKKQKKKKPRWGLIKASMPKAIRQYMDQDYINKLSEKEKDWLNKFNEEYYGNVFRGDKTITIKKGKHAGKKRKYKKGLHWKAKINRTKIYNQTNARNRDLYNKAYRLPLDPFLNKNLDFDTLDKLNYIIDDKKDK